MDGWTDGRTNGRFVFLMVFKDEGKATDGSFDFDVIF